MAIQCREMNFSTTSAWHSSPQTINDSIMIQLLNAFLIGALHSVTAGEEAIQHEAFIDKQFELEQFGQFNGVYKAL